MRLGWDDRQITAPEFAEAFEEIGVAAVAIHGRTRQQGFSGKVNLDGIRAVVEAVGSIPVVGNGDVAQSPTPIGCSAKRAAGRCRSDAGRLPTRGSSGSLCNGKRLARMTRRDLSTTGWPSFTAIRLRGRAARPRPGDSVLPENGALVSQVDAGDGTVSRCLSESGDDRRDGNGSLRNIAQGPLTGDRSDTLPEMQIPVPAGPVEHW